MVEEKLKSYPKTEKFKVVDTIGVPHPYMITPKHIVVASDEFSGVLGEEAIKRAEEKGIVCEICKKSGKGILPYSEHKHALLIEVDDERELKDVTGLKEYLLSIKEKTEKEGYAGFAFVQAKKKLKGVI
jgi:hypothetical protein